MSILPEYYLNDKCKHCYFSRNTHSFHKLKENNEAVYFYTCYSKNKETEGFTEHMRLELTKLKRKWIWIFDGLLFKFRYFYNISMAKSIINILSSNLCENLETIIIINQNLSFRIMILFIWRYIPRFIKNKIIFDKNKSFSNLLELDESLNILETELYIYN